MVDLGVLFGAVDACACDHERSALGPAAYFVDVMHLLGSSATALLDPNRREDLRFLELSTVNILTELPYIDLTNEVIEASIAGRFTVTDVSASLTAGTIPASVRAQFAAEGHPLLESATVRVLAGNGFIIRDGKIVAHLAPTGGQLSVFVVPQTSETAPNIRANPEHVFRRVYEDAGLLRGAPRGFTLPFLLGLAEARVFLAAMGVDRGALLEAFTAPGSARALETLGLSRSGWDVVTGKLARPFGDAYPRTTLAAVQVLATFLVRSGLTYEELQRVLATRFINPPGGPLLFIHFTDTVDLCNLDAAFFAKRDPTSGATTDKVLTEADADRIRRFVLLRRALGWSERSLDVVLTALGSPLQDPADDLLVALGRIQTWSARYGGDPEEWASLWAPLDADGDASVYARLFLNPAIYKPIDHALAVERIGGSFELVIVAADPAAAMLSKHEPAVLAGVQLVPADIEALRVEGLLPPDPTKLDPTDPGSKVPDLTFANLSLLHRVALLSRALGLSVLDLLLLRRLSGVDPFSVASTDAFIDLAQRIGRSAFSLAELAWVFEHTEVPGSSIAPSERAVSELAGALRAAIGRIRSDTTPTNDPSSDVLKAKLGSLWKGTTAETVAAMVSDAAVFRAEIASGALGQSFLDAFAAKVSGDATLAGRLTLDTDTGVLRLAGVMTDAQRSTLVTIASAPSVFVTAVQTLYDQPRLFLKAAQLDFLTPSDIDALFGPTTSSVDERIAKFLDRFLPFLRAVLTERAVENALASALSLDPPRTSALMAALAGDVPSLVAAADIAPTSDLAALGAAGFNGVLRAPFTEHFNFQAEGSAHVRLFVDGTTVLDANVASGTVARGSVNLISGRFHQFRVEVAPVAPGDTVQITWSSPSTPRELVPSAALYGAAMLDAFTAAFVRFTKARLLAVGFACSVKEIAYLASHAADFDGFDWTQLPVASADPKPWVRRWRRLDALAGLRRQLAPKAFELVDVFASAHSEIAVDPTVPATSKLWRELSGFSEAEVSDLGLDGGALLDEVALVLAVAKRGVAKKLGVSIARAASWAASEPDLATSLEIKQTAKAKHAEAEWPAVAGPLSDGLRKAKRDALVAHVLANDGRFDAGGANAVFDHFLIDPLVDCCCTTSRLKQAIGSLQLFVTRCSMGLANGAAIEPSLPSDVADQWSRWMRSYRVWEANRKIFLYPENWIEPELRTDKTPFFRDLENELLQGEIDADSAESAFRHYLEKLDEVARLQVAGFYHQQDDDGDVLHVIGRTFSDPRSYYYRTGTLIDDELGRYAWSPWEKVDADIQTDHLVPVVWHRRLYLIWPVFTELDAQAQASGPTEQKSLRIQLAWTHRQAGKWTARSLSAVGDALLIEPPKSPGNPPIGTRRTVPTAPSGRDAILDRSLYRFYTTFVSVPTGVMTAAGPEQVDQLVVVCAHPGVEAVKAGPQLGNWSVNKGTLLQEFWFSDCNGAPQRTPLRFVTQAFQPPTRSIIDGNGLREVREPTAAEKKAGEPDELNLLSKTAELDVLDTTPGRFRIALPNRAVVTEWDEVFFFEDDSKTFLVRPLQPAMTMVQIGAVDFATPRLPMVMTRGKAFAPAPAATGPTMSFYPGVRARYDFTVFYHPKACEALGRLNRGGASELLAWPMTDGQPSGTPIPIENDFFEARYQPTSAVKKPYPKEGLDLADEGATAYAQYNWELFFHAPLLIATRLAAARQFEAARRWFHAIFDPTGSPPFKVEPARYWLFRRFFDDTGTKAPDTIAKLLDTASYLGPAVAAWRAHPFDPHLVARTRLGAYQKTVVMKYIDNLIAWADALFRRETLEELNEATGLYILAAEILGRRPQTIPPPATATELVTFAELGTVDDFGESLLENAEDLVTSPAGVGVTESGWNLALSSATYVKLFCVPGNERLLGYWDTVADRLFKIRNCMNIDGVTRQLPLFEPPIDPGLLVRATAAGLDLGAVLDDRNAPLPRYRFLTVLAKAIELASEVRSLGAALLSALEKRDAEALAILRAGNEVDLLDAVRAVKEKQVAEAREARASLDAQRSAAEDKKKYYEGRPFTNIAEFGHLTMTAASLPLIASHIGADTVAGVLHLIPELTIGLAPGATYGGQNIAGGVQAFGAALGTSASLISTMGSAAATMGGYMRRQDDWDHQATLAGHELTQIDRQIAAAEIRQQIAEADLANHLTQTEQSRAVLETLRDRFTTEELHQWMSDQIAGVHFRSYELAYDLAKAAERAFQFEVGEYDARFVEFGAWDGARKGLLAGEKLLADLRRMESAYIERNRREFELTRHFSLAELDPIALLRLREEGRCFVRLPEALFDQDFPGHYLRRIRSVSVSIPCVTGPFRSVNATFTLLGNSVRRDPAPGVTYPRDEKRDDPRFIDNVGGIQSIATSHGQNDAGLFELNYRDERYLPFEGAGAISEWRIDLPAGTNRFDLQTISDVILHMRYTARHGGDALRAAAQLALDTTLQKKERTFLFDLVSARRDLGDEWELFMHPTDPAVQSLTFDLRELLPYQPRGASIAIVELHVFLRATGLATSPSVKLTGPTTASIPLDGAIGDLHHGAVPLSAASPGSWTITVDGPPIPSDQLHDLLLVVRYARP